MKICCDLLYPTHNWPVLHPELLVNNITFKNLKWVKFIIWTLFLNPFHPSYLSQGSQQWLNFYPKFTKMINYMQVFAQKLQNEILVIFDWITSNQWIIFLLPGRDFLYSSWFLFFWVISLATSCSGILFSGGLFLGQLCFFGSTLFGTASSFI